MQRLRHLLSVGRGTVLMRAYDTNDRENNAKDVHVQK